MQSVNHLVSQSSIQSVSQSVSHPNSRRARQPVHELCFVFVPHFAARVMEVMTHFRMFMYNEAGRNNETAGRGLFYSDVPAFIWRKPGKLRITHTR
jgi:hypothetical protein